MPLIALAIAVSAPYLAAKLGPHADAHLFETLATATVLGLLVVPYFDPPQIIGGPQIFPLNGPEYSLFLELVVNVFWFATRRIAQLPLALALCAISLVLMVRYGSGGRRSPFRSGSPGSSSSRHCSSSPEHMSRSRGARAGSS